MKPFKYSAGKDLKTATRLVSKNVNAHFLAGGTNILDLMKEDVEQPDELIDIASINLRQIVRINSGVNKGGVSIGALANNTDTANHPLVRKNHPLLAQAILAGASAQIRNMATNGGNLNQRTRCPYFYDVAMPCNKRNPGSGCGAKEGFNRMHAIFGWSDACIAVHPSDMCVALAALDAVVKVESADSKKRTIPFIEYHRLPGDLPQKDNTLLPGEIITSIEIPPNNVASHSYYLKVRDRASYAFALVSVAAAIELNGSTITRAKIAIGGVAHKPWRALNAENYLVGKQATDTHFLEAAKTEMVKARPFEQNKFKVEMGTRAIARALSQAVETV